VNRSNIAQRFRKLVHLTSFWHRLSHHTGPFNDQWHVRLRLTGRRVFTCSIMMVVYFAGHTTVNAVCQASFGLSGASLRTALY
jgi:hypothetical protein